jgi:hypothetical protein
VAGVVSDVAGEMTNVREERIDLAVCGASELIAALQDHGAVTTGQAKLIVEAAVRASVPNAEQHEIRASAKRVAADVSRYEK